MTKETKKRIGYWIVNVMVMCLIALFTFSLDRIGKSQDEVKREIAKVQEEQKRTNIYLGIEYESTDFALFVIHGAEYTNLKCSKRAELLEKQKYIEGDNNVNSSK